MLNVYYNEYLQMMMEIPHNVIEMSSNWIANQVNKELKVG
jgi:hypothetical protein